jgi:hypothetical protein
MSDNAVTLPHLHVPVDESHCYRFRSSIEKTVNANHTNRTKNRTNERANERNEKNERTTKKRRTNEQMNKSNERTNATYDAVVAAARRARLQRAVGATRARASGTNHHRCEIRMSEHFRWSECKGEKTKIIFFRFFGFCVYVQMPATHEPAIKNTNREQNRYCVSTSNNRFRLFRFVRSLFYRRDSQQRIWRRSSCSRDIVAN